MFSCEQAYLYARDAVGVASFDSRFWSARLWRKRNEWNTVSSGTVKMENWSWTSMWKLCVLQKKIPSIMPVQISNQSTF